MDIPDISCIKNKNILVVGDIILDHFCYGGATRVSPEAPVLVVKSSNEVYLTGGAANVAMNLRKLGCNVILCGFVGRDYYGKVLMSLMSDAGISTEYLDFCDETIVKSRIIASDQHVVRYDREKIFSNQNTTGDLCAHIKSSVNNVDGVILSDYNKGTINHDVVSLIRNNFDGPILADPKPENGHIFHDIYCITPNLGEAHNMFPDIHDTHTLMKHVKNVMHLDCVLFTMSENGIMFMDDHYNISKIDVHIATSLARERHHRIDVTGAGDTVISCFAACVVAGINPLLSAKVANVAASVVVNKIGTAYCSYDDLINELRIMQEI